MTGQPNAALAYKVLDHIDAHPEQWNQRHWDCGTAACFAGHAVRLSGGISQGLANADTEVVEVTDDFANWMVGLSVQDAAYHVLGIDDVKATATDPEAGLPYWLFDASHDRARLGRLVAEIFGPRPVPADEDCTCKGADLPHAPGLRGCIHGPTDDVPPNAGSAS